MVRLRERERERERRAPCCPHPAAGLSPSRRRRPHPSAGAIPPPAQSRVQEGGAAPVGAAQPWSEEGESTEGEGGERDLPGRRRRRFPGKETRRAARLLLFREEETFRERALAPIPRVSQPPGSGTFGPSGHLRGVAQGIAARFRAQIP